MNKLHSFAFYALVTPAIALSSGALFAEQATGQGTGDQSGSQSQDYMDSLPSDGMQASNLIGANIRTTRDEEVGAVSDLIIGQDGQVVAVVVSVGGFLGMGEKDVAISWDKVSKSGTSEERELRIDMTRDDLTSAPEYQTLE